MEMKEKKMTVIGEVDPICMVRKLRRFRRTQIISVGPPREEEKKKAEDKIEEVLNYYRYNVPSYWVQPYEQPPSCVIF